MQRLLQVHSNMCSEVKPEDSKVETEVLTEQQIGIIYLNSAKDLNVLSTPMRYQLGTALNSMGSNPSVKVVILLSKVEKAFCAGGDVRDLLKLTFELQNVNDVLDFLNDSFINLKKPLITGIHGIAFGGGFEIALQGDIIIASEETKLGLPELKLGIIPGLGGTQRLAHLAGRTNAMRYILTSDVMTAKEAKEMGVVSIVVKKEELKAECIRVAQRIADKSMASLICAKQAIKCAEEMPISQGNKQERFMMNTLLNSKSSQEGLGAFKDKRQANFRNL